MKNKLHALHLLPLLALLTVAPSPLHADDPAPTPRHIVGHETLSYKVISGLKQAFMDDLQAHLSKGWTPVGGVSVTVWNTDLYFAQLISKPSSE